MLSRRKFEIQLTFISISTAQEGDTYLKLKLTRLACRS